MAGRGHPCAAARRRSPRRHRRADAPGAIEKGVPAIETIAPPTEPANVTESRARMWRLAAHTRGRRHHDPDREEVFVPLKGTLTMLLGEPFERVDVPGQCGIQFVEWHDQTVYPRRGRRSGPVVDNPAFDGAQPHRVAIQLR